MSDYSTGVLCDRKCSCVTNGPDFLLASFPLQRSCLLPQPIFFLFCKLLEASNFPGKKKRSLREAKAVNLTKIKGCRALPHLLLLAFQALESRHIFPHSAPNMCPADLSALVRGESMWITFTASSPGIHKGRTNSIKETRGLLSLLHFVFFLLFFLALSLSF